MTKNEIATQNENSFADFVYQNKVEVGLAKALQQNSALLPRTLETERIAAAAGFYIANYKDNALANLDKAGKLQMVYGMQKEAMIYLEAGTDYDIVVFKGKPVICRKKDGWYKVIDMIKPAEIVRFVSNVATTGDTVSFNPVTEEVTHIMGGDRSQKITDIIAAYAYIKFANGFEKTVFWDKGDIDHARNLSPSKGSDFSPWNAHAIKMVETKIVKELAKKLFTLFGRRLSPMMQSAATVDDVPVRRITDAGAIEIDDRSEPIYTAPVAAVEIPEPDELDMNELIT